MLNNIENRQGAAQPGAGSAHQLRREAAKARQLADAAFGENEARRFRQIAITLDREATAIDAALARTRREA